MKFFEWLFWEISGVLFIWYLKGLAFTMRTIILFDDLFHKHVRDPLKEIIEFWAIRLDQISASKPDAGSSAKNTGE